MIMTYIGLCNAGPSDPIVEQSFRLRVGNPVQLDGGVSEPHDSRYQISVSLVHVDVCILRPT